MIIKIIEKILVFLQFSLIGIMFYFSNLEIHNYYSVALVIIGAIWAIWAISCNKFGNFNITPSLKENAILIQDGAYKYVRHPMYTSIVIGMFGIFLNTQTLIELLAYISLVLTLFLKATREEMLWSRANNKYLEYKKTNKMFLPFIF